MRVIFVNVNYVLITVLYGSRRTQTVTCLELRLVSCDCCHCQFTDALSNKLTAQFDHNSVVMLSSLIKEHQSKQAARKEAQDIKRKEAIAAANDLTLALVDHLNVGVAQAYLNQKRLDAEAKQLHQSATSFAKQTQQWLILVEGFSSALKEIGDVENWAKSIEDDMQTVNCALEYAYKVSQEGS